MRFSGHFCLKKLMDTAILFLQNTGYCHIFCRRQCALTCALIKYVLKGCHVADCFTAKTPGVVGV
jgi:hypothetical protein